MGALVVAGIVRPWWVLAPLVLLPLAWVLVNLDFLDDRYDLFNPFSGVEDLGPASTGEPQTGKRLTLYAGMLLTLCTFAGAAVAFLRLRARGLARAATPFALLAVTPLLSLAGQAYGGEGALRVVLFVAPWCAALAAWALTTIERPSVRNLTAVAVSVALAGLFVLAYFGQAAVHVVSDADRRASLHFYDHAVPGSRLVTAARASFPARVAENYARFNRAGSGGNLLGREALVGPALPPGAADEVASAVLGTRQDRGYVVFSSAQRRYAELNGQVRPGFLRELEEAVLRSPRFRLWYANEGVRIYELLG